MVFTTKHVIYQVKVCFRDLLVCWHFPLLTWVGQGTPVMWYSQLPQPHSRFAQSVCKYHCLVTWALWCLQPNTWCIRSKSLFSWPTCILAFSSSLSAPIRQQPVHLTWVGQGTPVMWFRFSRYHCLVTWVLWCLQLNTWFIRSKSVFMTYLYAAIFQPSRE